MTQRGGDERPHDADPLVLPAAATGPWRITISSNGRLVRRPPGQRNEAGPESEHEPSTRPQDEDRQVLGVSVPAWPVLNAAPLPSAADPADPADDEGEEFVPPDPPLPRWTSDRVHRTGWVLVLLGPVLFLVVGPLGWDPALRLVAGAVLVGGLVLLATRLPGESRRDDPDGGARV